MKINESAFRNTSFRLTFREWVGLLFGREIRNGPYIIGLWHMPGDIPRKKGLRIW